MLTENDSFNVRCQMEQSVRASEGEFGATLFRIETALTRPSVVFHPTIYQDGDAFCCRLGLNVQDGICGFGATPADACAAFDLAWTTRAKVPEPPNAPL